MSRKRKQNGRITVEDVDALFQGPLAMLHPPAGRVAGSVGAAAVSRSDSRSRAGGAPRATRQGDVEDRDAVTPDTDLSVKPAGTADATALGPAPAGSLRLHRKRLGRSHAATESPGCTGAAAAAEDPEQSQVRPESFWQALVARAKLIIVAPRAPAGPASTVDSDRTADLVARLSRSLVEASCLAAELQRRHRESLSEHDRLREEIRTLVALLAEQVDAVENRAPSPPGDRMPLEMRDNGH